MKRISRRRHIRKRTRTSERASLFVDSDAPFQAGAMIFWTILLLVGAMLTLDWLLRPDHFPVESVSFEGRFEHVTREKLTEITQKHVHGNFFAIDLDAVKAQVESLPWVYAASVRRRWPRHLHIYFTEQQLIARWGDDAWINDAGDLVKLGAQIRLGQLPRLHGPAGTHANVLARYRGFEHALASVGLHATAVTLTPRRTWEVELDNRVAIVLERENPNIKIARFVRVYPQTLASHVHKIKQVDLRYTNGFAVEWVEPPPPLAWLELED